MHSRVVVIKGEEEDGVEEVSVEEGVEEEGDFEEVDSAGVVEGALVDVGEATIHTEWHEKRRH